MATGVVAMSSAASAAPAPPTGTRFTQTAPTRVLDTRSGIGAPAGPVVGGAPITVAVPGVPAGATAVVLNLTGTEPTQSTFVTAYPGGSARPTASNLNLSAGETRPNLVTVALGQGGTVALYNHAGTVHLIADVAGFYSAGGTAKFSVLDPVRLLDTRAGTGPVAGGQSVAIDLVGRVPAEATAVTLNLTGTEPTQSTFVTAYPGGTTRPTASNLNLVAGQTSPNLVTVAVGADRKIALYNNSGSVHLIADVAGYYSVGGALLFTPVSPVRALDTRLGQGKVAGGTAVTADIAAVLPAEAGVPTAVVLNLTGTVPTQATYVAATTGSMPTTSNLNLSPGQTAANLAVVGLDGAGRTALYNHSGAVHLIADVAGYFAVPPLCAVGPGCLAGWGDNSAGQLGAGGFGGHAPPAPVLGLTGVTEVAAGTTEVVAVRGDGAVFGWGTGAAVPGGQSAVPVPVPQLGGDVEHVSATQGNALALKADGTVWAWGDGGQGQLGDGVAHQGTVSTPVKVTGLTDIRAVAMGDTTGYALGADGKVWAWGSNVAGALGVGTVCVPATGADCVALAPVRVHNLDQVIAISEDGFALRADLTVWTWGSNAAGKLGDGSPTTQPRSLPAPVPGLTDVVRISGGADNRYALRTDGSIRAWGANADGQLGNGSAGGQAGTPGLVSSLSEVVEISVGERGNGFAVRADGTVWAWGANAQGQLGSGFLGTWSPTPVQIAGVGGASAVSGYVHGAIAVLDSSSGG
ncbi:MAG TPA: hypothetical protein VM677_16460 [Actinokineospora sp.]|nr:hypothetical protein [Actinokineospora sp.]